MGLLSVIAAAVASWVFGAAYYMALAKPWTEAAGIEVDDKGRPVNDSPLPYIISMIVMLVVAGMMRHSFAMAGIDTLAKGVVAGLGIGAFFISPWIFLNGAYGGRPAKLGLIDAGYATGGAAIMGLVLTLF